MRRHILASIVASSCISCLCFTATAFAGDAPVDKDIVRFVDGVKHIANPATPRGAVRAVPLRQVWSVSVAAENTDLPLVGLITDVIQSGDDSICMLDPKLEQLLEFSIANGFVRVLSRSGEGPGEVSQPISITSTQHGKVAVARRMPGEIVVLDGAGSHTKRNVKIVGDGVAGFVTLDRIARLSEGFVVRGSALRVTGGNQDVCSFLSIVNEDGVEQVNLLRRCTAFSKLATGEGLKEIGTVSEAILACGDLLYLAENPDEYAITVYDFSGDVQHVIRREFTRRRYSTKERDSIRAVYEEMKNKAPQTAYLLADIPILAPSIQTIVVRENGDLWVLPDREPEPEMEGSGLRYDAFDARGYFVETVRLESETGGVGDGESVFVLKNCVVTLRGLMNRVPGVDASQFGDDDAVEIACYRFN